MDYVNEQKKRTKKTILTIIIVGFSIGAIAKIYSIVFPKKIDEKVLQKQKESKNNEGCAMAYIIAKPLIAKQLDAPETAEFPFFTYHCERQDGNNYFIQGEVEFKNIYNVPFKKVYRAVVHFNGGEDADNKNWELVSFKFIG